MAGLLGAPFALGGYKDVKTVPQDDGPHPVVPISYSQGYVELMDIFRGLLAVDEVSARGLRLTTELMGYNAANYTLWHYRRKCLKSIGADLHEELSWVTNIGGSNPKNYQIWFHRRALVEQIGTAEAGQQELQYTEIVFAEDAKNYHAWGHRQWVLEQFKLYENELEFIESLLKRDVRNNSVWNQRWFYFMKTLPENVPDSIVKQEINFCFSKLDVALKNQAAWAYLEGWMSKRDYKDYPEIEAYIRGRVLEQSKEVAPAFSALIDILEQKKTQEGRNEALKLIDNLCTFDVIRKKYWLFRKREIAQ